MEAEAVTATFVSEITSVLEPITEQFTFTNIASILAIVVGAAAVLTLSWFGVRKVISVIQRALKRDKLRLFDLFRLHKWRADFRKAHPYMFGPIGTMIFCGSQGKGKTLSAVNYVCNVLKDYPFAVLVTNVGIKDYPFNAYYKVIKGQGLLFDNYHVIGNCCGALQACMRRV